MNQNNNIIIKKLLYQSKYRGCKESEMILEKFANRYLNELDDNQLIEFQEMLILNDADLLDWLLGKKPIPTHLTSNTMLEKLYKENK